MPIKAQIIEHSVSPRGKELITIELEYPRFIHGELMTHRVFSRNAASSRAIPVMKMIEQVEERPVVPLHWGVNQPGMQAREELTGKKREEAIHEWERASAHAAYFARSLHGLGVHKQIANRLLEPFQWMKTIVTATEWDNFFELRRHPDAEPHFQLLAEAMWRAIIDSGSPVPRGSDPSVAENWHLPYLTAYERSQAAEHYGADAGWWLARLSAARCARVSYMNHDGTNPDVNKDLETYQKLVGSRPLHASPLEHQAFPLDDFNGQSGNFRGWAQYRKFVEQSFVELEAA
jgi:thymidylate synthase ThyX